MDLFFIDDFCDAFSVRGHIKAHAKILSITIKQNYSKNSLSLITNFHSDFSQQEMNRTSTNNNGKRNN